MEKVVPWARRVKLIEPHYPKGKRGRPPIGIARMLRISFLQQWYGLANELLEETIYDSQAMRGFTSIELSVESVPDATSLLRFRHLLEAHKLTRAILDTVNGHLCEHKLILREGTIVDATIIAAPSSTKNTKKERDPEMHQTKKGNAWHFGMKAHIGVVARGVPLSLLARGANVHDVKLLEATLEAIVISRPIPNVEAPQHLCAGAGYTGAVALAHVRERNYQPHINLRREQAEAKRTPPGFVARRWIVERTHSRINRWRKLLVSFEKSERSFLALLALASAMIYWRQTIPIYGCVLS